MSEKGEEIGDGRDKSRGSRASEARFREDGIYRRAMTRRGKHALGRFAGGEERHRRLASPSWFIIRSEPVRVSSSPSSPLPLM